MGQDDDADCEHRWRLDHVEFRTDGSWSDYRCERCPGVLLVAPMGEHPQTV